MKRTSKRPTRSAVKFTPAGWPERLARQVALVACPPVLRGERRHPEPVREFESEIHKFLSLNNLRVLSLIKVDSLLARTYVGERRILGQAPRKKSLTGSLVAWPFFRDSRHFIAVFPAHPCTEIHSLRNLIQLRLSSRSPHFSRDFPHIGSLVLTRPPQSDIWGPCLTANPIN